MSVHSVNLQNFEEEVIRSEKPVLLDFWAPWCGPCRMIAPILEEIAAERPDIKVCKVNVDEQIDLSSRYRIVSIPTLLVIENGRMEDKIVGYRPKQDILDLFG